MALGEARHADLEYRTDLPVEDPFLVDRLGISWQAAEVLRARHFRRDMDAHFSGPDEPATYPGRLVRIAHEAPGRAFELHASPYLEPLRGHPPFEELLQPRE